MSAGIQDEVTATPSEVSSSPLGRLSPIREKDELVNKICDEHNEHTTIFHKDCDLIFKIKAEQGYVEYKVSAANVSSASEVFNRLLYVTSSPHPKQGTFDVIETSDNPAALMVLMQIIHYKFNQVPKTPSIDDLFEICILVSKYECTHLIEPWAERWAALLNGFAGSEGASSKNYKVLWAAWVLGCVKPFREMIDSLILTSTANEDGELLHVGGSKLQDLILPQGLLDGMFEIRSKTLDAILNEIRNPMDHMSGINRLPEAAYCKVGSDTIKCEMMMFASATPMLVTAGLFPVPQAKDFSRSIAAIKEVIYGIKYEAWVGKDFAPHKAHTACTLGLKNAVETILTNMASPVQDVHLNYLAEQAARTGVDNGTALLGFGSKLDASVPESMPTGIFGREETSMTIETESVDTDDDSVVEEVEVDGVFDELATSPESDEAKGDAETDT